MDKKTEETKKEQIQKPFDIISVSPNYFLTSIDLTKFFKGSYIEGNKIVLGKTFNQDIEGKIRVHEDRVKGWFLDYAKMLIKEKHADFVVLMICVSYLEGIQQFKEGKSSKRDSGESIKRALKTIFNIPKDKEWALDTFIKEARHGLFHDGMTKNNIVLSRGIPSPISIKKGTDNMISINPILFLWEIEEDFKEYINDLKNPNNKELREKFEKHWNERYPQLVKS